LGERRLKGVPVEDLDKYFRTLLNDPDLGAYSPQLKNFVADVRQEFKKEMGEAFVDGYKDRLFDSQGVQDLIQGMDVAPSDVYWVDDVLGVR